MVASIHKGEAYAFLIAKASKENVSAALEDARSAVAASITFHNLEWTVHDTFLVTEFTNPQMREFLTKCLSRGVDPYFIHARSETDAYETAESIARLINASVEKNPDAYVALEGVSCCIFPII